jgi:ketosteroid isomerase-like protein
VTGSSEVAAALEAGLAAGPAAFRRALGSLYADQVEYRHEPPLPSDGFVDGARLGASADREATALTGALADARYGEHEVIVEGDVVAVSSALEGTLPDGRGVSLPLRMRCRVEDGRIAAVTHAMGAEVMRAWAEVAVAGGMVGAAKLLEVDEPR